MNIINDLVRLILLPFNILRSYLIKQIRINRMAAQVIYDEIKNNKFKIDFNEELLLNNAIPRESRILTFYNGIPISFRSEERMLRAGHAAVDAIFYITVPTFYKKKIIKYIMNGLENIEADIPIYLINKWDCHKISNINKTKYINSEILIDQDIHKKCCDLVEKVMSDKDMYQAGILLYSEPGNGKSYYIRQLAAKYKLPIFTFSAITDWDSVDLVTAFSHVQANSIILFEDFDALFNGRDCVIENIRFDFSTLLNIFDGIYALNKNNIFIMTANDISKIDEAIKNRPSRFQVVEEILNVHHDRLNLDNMIIQEKSQKLLENNKEKQILSV